MNTQIEQSLWGNITPITTLPKLKVKEHSPQLIAFNSEQFRRQAEIAVSKIAKYLNNTNTRGLELKNPKALLREARSIMMETPAEGANSNENKFKKLIDLYIKTGIQVYSPGYMGRQFSGVIPLSAVTDFVSSMVSQPSSFYEAGQLPNIAERIMAEEFNEFIGWEPDTFSMITCSGGSLANMTAILAARNDRYPNLWSEGYAGLKSKIPAIAVSEDAHYSISRAAGILGIGDNQIVRLPINEKRQIDINQVRPTLAKAAARGLDVFCLVGSAGSTSVGAIDSLDKLADIAQELKIWFHVDGAHGASLMVSDQLRYKLNGLNKADSFAWDAHKMMFMPATCTLLFYKNKEKSDIAFQQKASYVFEKEPDIYSQFETGDRNFECTKRPMIMPLWICWSMYGKELFSSKLEYLCRLTEYAYKALRAESDFTTIHRPETNILCFKYTPINFHDTEIPDLQIRIRNQITKRGTFFISKIDLNDDGALRVVFMNHEIEMHHFYELLDEIRIIGQEIINEEKLNHIYNIN